ncbi:MAG: rhodanese-like domain-containing protein [Clostridiales bacterium]|nr:rhodanese-like domain-containing protein [Clostridiales bacterium]
MFDFITISDAVKLCYSGQGMLVDVRPEEEYRAGHLPMAENVPLKDILDGRYRPDVDIPLFLYCDTGSDSLLAARKLDEDGVHVYTVAGGIGTYKGYLEK